MKSGRLQHDLMWITAIAMSIGGVWAEAAPPIPTAPVPTVPKVAPKVPVRPAVPAPRVAMPATAVQKPATAVQQSTPRTTAANQSATLNANTLNTNATLRANLRAMNGLTTTSPGINAAGTTTTIANPSATAAQANAANPFGQAKGVTSSTTNATALNDSVRGGFGPSASQIALNQSLNTNSVASQLNLSSGQISQINSFQNNFNQEMISLNNRFASDPQGTSSLAAQARQQLQQQINSVLTPQQRVNLSQLSGQPDPFSGDNAFANANTSTTANNLLNYGALNMLTGNNGLLPASAMSPMNSGIAMTNNTATNNLLGANQRPSTANGTQAGVNAAMKPNAQLTNATGFSTITNPNVQKALNLTNQQIAQLQQFQLDYAQQLGSLSSQFQTNPQNATTLYNNAISQSQQRINSVLTPTQRQILSNITGVPDTFSGDSSLPQTLPTTPSQ